MEDADIFRDQFSYAVELIAAKTVGYEVQLNWTALQGVIRDKNGVPTAVGAVAAIASKEPQANAEAPRAGDGLSDSKVLQATRHLSATGNQRESAE